MTYSLARQMCGDQTGQGRPGAIRKLRAGAGRGPAAPARRDRGRPAATGGLPRLDGVRLVVRPGAVEPVTRLGASGARRGIGSWFLVLCRDRHRSAPGQAPKLPGAGSPDGSSPPRLPARPYVPATAVDSVTPACCRRNGHMPTVLGHPCEQAMPSRAGATVAVVACRRAGDITHDRHDRRSVTRRVGVPRRSAS
jgi:hypothetical protein